MYEMAYQPWILVAMEAAGYGDTNEALINRVVQQLSQSTNDTINTDEFCSACIECGVDPNSFTRADLDKLQKKLRCIL